MSFAYQPGLCRVLVALRPLAPGDYDALYAVASDPLLWAQHPVRNRHEAPVFRAFFEASLASGGALVALDAASGQVIGASRFHGYDAARGRDRLDVPGALPLGRPVQRRDEAAYAPPRVRPRPPRRLPGGPREPPLAARRR
jgi:hypothetical protein